MLYMNFKVQKNQPPIKSLFFLLLISFLFLGQNVALQAMDSFKEKAEEELYNKGIKHRNEKKFSEAKDCFLPLAEKGYVKAQHNLAMCYYKMDDEITAYAWLKLAAHKGFEPSSNNLRQMNLLYTLLSNELLVYIVSSLDVKDFGRFKRVSKRINVMGNSSACILSKNPEDIKLQILSHASLDDLYLKVKRTKNGFEQLALGFQSLANDTDALRTLAHSDSGAFRLLAFHPFFLKKFPFQIDTLNKLIKNAKILWKEEAKKDDPIADFNYGEIQLFNGEIKEASLSFEKAVAKGGSTALHNICAIGDKYYIEGKKEKAKLCWELAAKFDRADAQYNLGVMANEQGNFDEALNWYVKAATKGHSMALSNITIIGRKFYEEGKKEKAKKCWEYAAKFDDTHAQNNLGAMAEAQGNFDGALNWYVKAATKGHSAAISNIYAYGTKFYEEGKKEEARKWWEHAATFDHAVALFNLGVMAEAQGNFDDALNWYVKATTKGHSEAIDNICAIASKFDEEGKNEKEKECWELAAKFDHADAQYNLGIMAGVQSNFDEALSWFVKAATKGHSAAINNICAIASDFGKEGKEKKARECWELAAKFDDAGAQFNLGIMASELGNFDEALNWYVKAATNGYSQAIDNIYATGIKFYQEGSFEEARKWLAKAAENGHVLAIKNLKLI